MPQGIVIILILTVIILFDFGRTLHYHLALTKAGAVILFSSLTLTYIINPLYLEGVSAYYLPYLILVFYSLKLLLNLKHKIISLLLGTVSALVLYFTSQIVPPQPIGLIYEPFFIYSLIIAVINILFSYGIRSLIFNSIFGFTVFNSILIFTNQYNVVLPHSAFSAVCISALIACYPVSLLSKGKLFFKYQRDFQEETGEELIFKKRKW